MTAGEEQVKKGRILIVDDEEGIRVMLSVGLEREGYEVDLASDGESALKLLLDEQAPVDLVIMDLKMPGMDGLEALRQIKASRPDLLVVLITAFSTWATACEAMRLGAYDYIRKPFDTEELKRMVNRALEMKHQRETIPDEKEGPGRLYIDLVGNTPPMLAVHEMIRRIGPTNGTILIHGESGTGKELVARAVHYYSLRRPRPFVTVNCGVFTETLLQSELFGHVKGAFTGAVSDREGLLDAAEKGTLFLDEIGEMSLQMQVKLLRVLEDREFVPMGSTKSKMMNVRFVAATNKNLEQEVHEGNFRQDLFYRLNVIPIALSPLRDRQEDIPLLAGYFLAKYAGQMEKDVRQFSSHVMKEMTACDWPGNVRELENVVHRAVALNDNDTIMQVDLPGRAVQRSALDTETTLDQDGVDLPKLLDDVESDYISQALERTGGNMTQAAELLGMSFRSIRYKVKKLGIDKKT